MISEENRKYVLVAAGLSSFLVPFTGSAVNLAVPSIARSLQLDTVAVNHVISSYLIASAVVLLPLGRAADVYGRRKIFRAGLVCFTLFSALAALARSGDWLIAFRVGQGLGGAMLFGTVMALVTQAFPPEKRGQALGLNVGAVYAGLSLGPPVGGLLTHHLGWRAVFFTTTVLGIAATVIAFAKLPPLPRNDDRGKFAFGGASIYALALTLMMWGMSEFRSNRIAPYALLGGVALFAVFVFLQKSRPAPLVELSLFRHRAFVYSNLAAFIHYSATAAGGFLVSLYLQVVRGMDAQRAGLIMLIQPVMMMVLSPATGKLSDRVEPRLLATAGMALTCVGLGMFATLSESTPIGLIVFILFLLGTGFALFSSPNTNAVMSSVGRGHLGVASATISTMRTVGQAISMVMVSMLIASYVGRVELKFVDPHALVRAAGVSFMAFALLCLPGMALSLARGDVRKS